MGVENALSRLTTKRQGLGRAPGPAPVNQLGQDPGARANVAGRINPALATRRWSSKAMRMRSGWWRGSIYWVLPFWDRFSVSKPLSQKHGSTFLPLLSHTKQRTFMLNFDSRYSAIFGPRGPLYLRHLQSHRPTECRRAR